jgi:diguanylate cyclase (GGDEF)-like protein
MVERQLPKLHTRVRFPLPAPVSRSIPPLQIVLHRNRPSGLFCLSGRKQGHQGLNKRLGLGLLPPKALTRLRHHGEMTVPTFSLLIVAADEAWRPGLTQALGAALDGRPVQLNFAPDLRTASTADAVLLHLPAPSDLTAWAARRDLVDVASDTAVLVVTDEQDAASEDALLAQGVQGFLTLAQVSAAAAPSPQGQGAQGPSAETALARTLRHALQRKHAERSARHAYATDLATGLPHEVQLLEHMAQLLALRERQPEPLVLIALRIEGYARAAERLGVESANVLRRKVAVRLRGGLRASDVVAALGQDTFAVLLGHVDAITDGERVAAKLVRALQQPFTVAGQACTVGAVVGMAHHPQHGKDPRALLQRASAQAAGVATVGAAGVASMTERRRTGAANDNPAMPAARQNPGSDRPA